MLTDITIPSALPTSRTKLYIGRISPEHILLSVSQPFITTPHDLIIGLLEIATPAEIAAMRATINSLTHPGPTEGHA